ncbi:MAG: hypothetical protein LUI09_02460 [Prevotellaceae bacterium]|nr:hypothetical protein [Prevotellaceae bacterium]
MKKNFVRMMSLLAVLAVPFAFSSCSDDDDTPASYSIVGSWTEEDSAGSEMTFDFTFKSNGTGKFVVTYVTDYTINGVETDSKEYDFEYKVTSDGAKEYLTFMWADGDNLWFSSNYQYTITVTKTSFMITLRSGNYYLFDRV